MIANISPSSSIEQNADSYVKPFGQIFSNTLEQASKERYYTIKLPETLFSALRRSPDEFVQEMRLAAAVKWYELQLVSQGKAAEIAGMSRYAFLEALSRFNVSPFQVTPEELLEEIARD